ncbi:MAG: phytoene desaturase family protein [Bacteroidota bacterium]
MPKEAIVIGSGFGGLAAANRLQAMGLRVKLFEMRPKLGGRAYQLRENGYTFDMGPSLVTATEVIDSIFQAAGRSMTDYLDLVPLDPYYRVHFHDGTSIDYTGDPVHMKQQMERFDARDAARYDDFMESIRPIYDAVITGGLGAQPFDTVRSMVEFLPQAMRLKAYLPVTTYVNRYFRDFRHRFLYSFHPLFIGGNPFRSPSVYLMIPYLEAKQGVWYAKGGMYSLVEALARLFVDQGGLIQTDAEVTEIVVKDGRATGVVVNGEAHSADVVVSNADVSHTYRSLVAPSARGKWTDRKLERVDYTMSCFLLYLGVRRTYPELAHHTLILSERYKDLVEDIFERKILADDFSMYLHAPTRSDPSMAPPGGESLYVLIPVPNLTADVDWDKEAAPFTRKIIDFLEAWGLEGLSDNLEVCRQFTPLDFESQLHAAHGNAFGIEPKLLQTAYFRPHNRSEDVDGLYLVGAGTHPGAGVPGVMLSAEAVANCVGEDLDLIPSTSQRVEAHV